jgi:hypothetical protein
MLLLRVQTATKMSVGCECLVPVAEVVLDTRQTLLFWRAAAADDEIVREACFINTYL